MDQRPQASIRPLSERPPFECVALLLQGGGALGAYQAGVYEALSECHLYPNWFAGISIGAINAALMAGNPPEHRVEKLRAFWEGITSEWGWNWGAISGLPFGDGFEKVFSQNSVMRTMLNEVSAGGAMLGGAPGFFTPRSLAPWLYPDGTPEATSYYDTSSLKQTLERLIDFDRLNSGETRLSVGAVNIRSGNFVYFDTAERRVGPEHVMASGALPPALPAVEIDGEYYWDGGLVSNTPLQWVLESVPRHDTLAFQVDLWSARGRLPKNLAEVVTREKEIRFSSRTRAVTDFFRRLQTAQCALAALLPRLPAELKESPEAALLRPLAINKVYNIVHLIYRSRAYEGDTKDYEFSRNSMQEHWRAGYNDAARTLSHPEIFRRPDNPEGFAVFDLTQDDRKDIRKP
jgi:NTE family protein